MAPKMGRGFLPLLEPDRLGLKQEGSRFFEKKRRKKLLFAWARGGETSMAHSQKGFFASFLFTKRSLPLR
jgi:hypothetical protein